MVADVEKDSSSIQSKCFITYQKYKSNHVHFRFHSIVALVSLIIHEKSLKMQAENTIKNQNKLFKLVRKKLLMWRLKVKSIIWYSKRVFYNVSMICDKIFQ